MSRVAVRLAAASLLALCAAPARAGDVVALTDGRFIEDVPMTADGGAVVLHYPHGDVRVPKERIEDYLIGGQGPPEASSTDDDRAKRAQGLVPYRGKWVKPEARDKAMADERKARQAEIDDAKAHAEWRSRYKFQTKDFEFESTYTKRLNDQYAVALEQYFDVFRRDWAIKAPKDWGKLIVCFYRDRETFERTAGGRGGLLAYYVPVANGGPRTERTLNCYYDDEDADLSMHCLFHECSHYMQDLVAEGTFWIPHWLGESMAEYYGSVRWDPEKKLLTTGVVLEDRLVETRRDIEAGQNRRLEKMIVEGTDGGPYSDYYWGWTFTHFLLNTPAYAKKYQQFFMDLGRSKEVKRKPGGPNGMSCVDGQECLRFFKKRMGVEDLSGMEKEWYAYVDKLPADTLRGIERAGMTAYGAHLLKFRAPRLLKLAIDKGSRNSTVHLMYAMCNRLKPDGREAAMTAVEKACEYDPLNAFCWAMRSYVVAEAGDAEGAKKYLDLARDIDPDGRFSDPIKRKAAAEGDDQ